MCRHSITVHYKANHCFLGQRQALLSKCIAPSFIPLLKELKMVDGLYLHKVEEYHTPAQMFFLLSVLCQTVQEAACAPPLDSVQFTTNSSSPTVCQGGLTLTVFCSDGLDTYVFGFFLQGCHPFLIMDMVSCRDSNVIFSDCSYRFYGRA